MPLIDSVITLEVDGDPTLFDVFSFNGTEGLSTLFSYTITLASKEPTHDFDKLLESKIHLIFGEKGNEQHVHGMLSSIQQGYDASWHMDSGERSRVDVVLVPDMWKLNLNVQTRFFRKMAVKEVIQKVLGDYGLQPQFSLNHPHPKYDSILQYQESDLDFIQRLCEREGIHYHFVHDESEEKIHFADSNSVFQTVQLHDKLPLRQPVSEIGGSINGTWGQEKTVTRFQSRQKFMPKKVMLQDYNDLTPTKDLKVEGESPEKASEGVQYFYGEHYKNTGEGNALLDMRKQDILARRRVFIGHSNAYRFYAGGTFDVTGTDKVDPELAKEYVITEIQVEGSQPLSPQAQGKGFNYSNTFTCLLRSIEYRPPLRTRRPEMTGLFHAKVCANNGDYADVEDAGRYHVQFVFDVHKASSIPVRLMEPYVGGTYGFHAPLHQGVEVLVGFENGDPDRPIIVSAAHNPEFPNTVTSKNHTQSVWRSAGNNEIMMEDNKGSEKFYQHCEKDLEIKTENDKTETTGHDEKLEVGNDRTRLVKNNEKVEVQSNREKKIGADETIEIGGNKKSTIKGNKDATVNGNFTEGVDGNQDVTVTGNETLTIKGTSDTKITGATTLKIDGNSTITIGGNLESKVSGSDTENVDGNQEVTIGGDQSVEVGGELGIEAGTDVGIEAGLGFEMESGIGFEISAGTSFEVEAKTGVEIKAGTEMELEGSSGVTIKGSKYEVKADGEVTVKGSVVKLN